MSAPKSLEYLLASVACSRLAGPDPQNVFIETVVSDSRKVGEKALFVALPGTKDDGHRYLADAAAKGCAALIVEMGTVDADTFRNFQGCLIAVEDSREAYAAVVANFYDHPEKSLILIGITGTNGKTTITYLLEKVLTDQGLQVGVIGTVNYRYADGSGRIHEFPAPFTTPDPLLLQSQLRRMADAGVTVVIMEVSSHALVQKRLGHLQFDVAAFTQLSHDHLDYHRNMDEYFRAKTLLFTDHLKSSATAVVTGRENDMALEDRWVRALIGIFRERNIHFLTCGRQQEALIQPLEVTVALNRTEVALLTPAGRVKLVSPLIGRFNVDNILTTLGIVSAMDLSIAGAVQSLQTATGAPGRLERVELQRGVPEKTVVLVDYAHTPDALFNVLQTLKALPHGRLFCVFGCGGDRDTAKRPQMGKIAARYADIAVITDDNPRSEEPGRILEQIVEGVRSAGMKAMSPEWQSKGETGYVLIGDRRQAIHNAVRAAAGEDIVLIAGKGHEKYQITAGGKRFFDDCLEAREALFSWDCASITEALGRDPVNCSCAGRFSGVGTDSRNLQPGQLFVALRGENFDGHDYLERALAAGAGALIIADAAAVADEHGRPIFVVEDTLRALGDLAAYRRRKLAEFTAPIVVGITGSCGKTTVKEMTAAIFEQRWPDGDRAPRGRVLRTTGNFNNLVGLPLSLLPMRLQHRAAILEMGMNQPGEIARLTEIADPDISCIINVHGAHLQGLGSIEGVAAAKEELFAGTGAEGVLVVNLDDSHVVAMAAGYRQRKICYGIDAGSGADLSATDITTGAGGRVSFILHIGDLGRRIELTVPGRHNVTNALAAAAIAHAAGLGIEPIVAGLQSFQAVDKRLQVITSVSGCTIINDTYNANPGSMAAALATLAGMAGKEKIALLGDMLELGLASAAAHRELGRKAAAAGVTALAVCGDFAGETIAGARAAGIDQRSVHLFPGKEEMGRWAVDLLASGKLEGEVWILVKASRGMRFETVVEKLVGKTVETG